MRQKVSPGAKTQASRTFWAWDLGMESRSSATWSSISPVMGELFPHPVGTTGWGLVSVTCEDPDGGSTFDFAGTTVVIDVDLGEQIVCTFLNRSDDYAPQPIPILSTWMLLLLVGLLAVAGVVVIRH